MTTPISKLSDAQYDMLTTGFAPRVTRYTTSRKLIPTINALCKAGYITPTGPYEYQLTEDGETYINQLNEKIEQRDYKNMDARETKRLIEQLPYEDTDTLRSILFNGKYEDIRTRILHRLEYNGKITDEDWRKLAHDQSPLIRIKAVEHAPIEEFRDETYAPVIQQLIASGKEIPRSMVETWLNGDATMRFVAVSVADDSDIDRLLQDPNDQVFCRTIVRFGYQLTRRQVEKVMARENGRRYLALYGGNLDDDIIRQLMSEIEMVERLRKFRKIVHTEDLFADKNGKLIEEQRKLAREENEWVCKISG